MQYNTVFFAVVKELHAPIRLHRNHVGVHPETGGESTDDPVLLLLLDIGQVPLELVDLGVVVVVVISVSQRLLIKTVGNCSFNGIISGDLHLAWEGLRSEDGEDEKEGGRERREQHC